MAEMHRPTQGRTARLRAALLGSAAILGLGMVALEQPAWSQSSPPPANANVAAVQDEGYADLAAAVMPAVVNVQVESTGGPERQSRTPLDDPDMRRFFERFFGQMPEGTRPQPRPPQQRRTMGEGSGFIISSDGYIVTNNHVAGNASKITVTLSDGTDYQATLKGADEKTDLALIKIESPEPLPYVAFGNSDTVRPGQKVIAVGNPFGLGGTVTAGIVSATGREIGSGPYDDFLQIDAPINRGNSGGPTFNLKGEVIGVNTAIFSPSGGSIGIGFAIASNQVKQVIDDLRDDGKVERGWLGVAIQGVDEDLAKALRLDKPRGALVSRVEDGSPAQKAGVRRGDVVLDFNGKPIERVGELSRAVAGVDAGTRAEIVVWRDGKQESLRAEIGLMPGEKEVAAVTPDEQEADQPRLGVSLAPLTADTRQQLGIEEKVDGVVVTDVAPDSPAESKGLQPGDIILSVDQKAVKDPRQVSEAVRKARDDGHSTVLLLIMREGQQIFEAVPLATS
jgi:serine protease Do